MNESNHKWRQTVILPDGTALVLHGHVEGIPSVVQLNDQDGEPLVVIRSAGLWENEFHTTEGGVRYGAVGAWMAGSMRQLGLLLMRIVQAPDKEEFQRQARVLNAFVRSLGQSVDSAEAAAIQAGVLSPKTEGEDPGNQPNIGPNWRN